MIVSTNDFVFLRQNIEVMGKFGTTEIILIVVLVLLLFGGKKIPELMKGLGKGIREFKDGVKAPEDAGEDNKS